jgi:hypothetical protein
MGDVWKNGRNNEKSIWMTVSKKCVEIQNMEVTVREKLTEQYVK